MARSQRAFYNDAIASAPDLFTMKKTTLPVALIQDRDQGSREANLANIEARVGEAAQRGARLVLLQELHNGPYFCQHESVNEFDLAETIPDPGHRTLVLRLAQNAGGGQTLGKFRVSVLAVEKKFPEKWTDQYSNLLNILK